MLQGYGFLSQRSAWRRGDYFVCDSTFLPQTLVPFLRDSAAGTLVQRSEFRQVSFSPWAFLSPRTSIAPQPFPQGDVGKPHLLHLDPSPGGGQVLQPFREGEAQDTKMDAGEAAGGVRWGAAPERLARSALGGGALSFPMPHWSPCCRQTVSISGSRAHQMVNPQWLPRRGPSA